MVIRQSVRRSIRTAGIVAAIVTVGLLALLTSVHSVALATNRTTNTLKVSPLRTDVEIKAGTNKTVQTRVTNLTETEIAIRPVENDFISGDERGTPALILDETKYAPTHSLKRFMTPLSDVTIPAGETKVVDVRITVPSDAQAGGYFGAIRFTPTLPSSGGQVNLNTSVASLILLTVPGDTVEKLELTSFTIQQSGTAGTYFTKKGDLQASVRFENKGNLQVGPFGKLSVKKGTKVVYETDFNNRNPRDVILPDAARRWDIPLKDVSKFGRYTLSATFTYGQKNKTIGVTDSFWVIPREVVIVAILCLIVLIAMVVGVWVALRNRKHRHKSRRHGRHRVGFRR